MGSIALKSHQETHCLRFEDIMYEEFRSNDDMKRPFFSCGSLCLSKHLTRNKWLKKEIDNPSMMTMKMKTKIFLMTQTLTPGLPQVKWKVSQQLSSEKI